MIEIHDLSKRFPGVQALNGVTLNVRKGEFFGLLGPNGAGKSTLMNVMVGYLDADAGSVSIDGVEVNRDALATRASLGLVPQSLALYDDLSAEENLEIFGSLYGIRKRTLSARIEHMLESVQLQDRRKEKVKVFSGGMKRRLNLIASLLHDPPLLLCDEPTVGVDPQSRNAIFDYLERLNREGKTIVYTTHYMEEAERLCNRIAIIDAGAIMTEGTLDSLLDKLAYEESIEIVKNPETISRIDMFSTFGAISESPEKYELKPARGFLLSTFFHALEQHQLPYKYVHVRKPTLEALFLQLTGRSLRD